MQTYIVKAGWRGHCRVKSTADAGVAFRVNATVPCTIIIGWDIAPLWINCLNLQCIDPRLKSAGELSYLEEDDSRSNLIHVAVIVANVNRWGHLTYLEAAAAASYM